MHFDCGLCLYLYAKQEDCFWAAHDAHTWSTKKADNYCVFVHCWYTDNNLDNVCSLTWISQETSWKQALSIQYSNSYYYFIGTLHNLVRLCSNFMQWGWMLLKIKRRRAATLVQWGLGCKTILVSWLLFDYIRCLRFDKCSMGGIFSFLLDVSIFMLSSRNEGFLDTWILFFDWLLPIMILLLSERGIKYVRPENKSYPSPRAHTCSLFYLFACEHSIVSSQKLL